MSCFNCGGFERPEVSDIVNDDGMPSYTCSVCGEERIFTPRECLTALAECLVTVKAELEVLKNVSGRS